jgi:DNA-binding NarL/FixJ family response regulator
VGEANGGQAALEAFKSLRPDITLMDLRMSGVDGIAATKSIVAEDPDARIIALTSYDTDHEIYSALEAGVRGYLLKEMVHTEVVRAIRIVHGGKRLMPPEITERLNEQSTQSALTQREVEVLRMAAQGLGNKEIGQHLGMAAGTAKMHLQNIFSKLGVSDRTHAVTLALQRGIIRLDS